MSDVAIRAEGLSKRYRIGERQRYRSLRESLTAAVSAPFRRHRRPAQETIWALQDVSFEVKRGEVVGVIGRNGAGKSTLLKILSRITEPTSGRAEVHGRVGSLLEVGTGFHNELTGRENIYLNGAILGMKRAEIARKFDEIVAFAEVERFIDTPVKQYSSGMYLRLAFAVAAHLEPEILLVDEVLAVGDADFQKKCLGKMGEVSKQGRTVLFVSHNMAAIAQLCSTAILLEAGSVGEIGPTGKVVRRHLALGDTGGHTVNLTDFQRRRGSGAVVFESVRLLDSLEQGCRDFSLGDDILVVFTVRARREHVNRRVRMAVQLRSSDGLPVCNMIDVDSGFQISNICDHQTVSVRLSDIRLYPDTYFITLWVGSLTSTEEFDCVSDCISFTIVDGGTLTCRRLPRSAGILFLTPEWRVQRDGTQVRHSIENR